MVMRMEDRELGTSGSVFQSFRRVRYLPWTIRLLPTYASWDLDLGQHTRKGIEILVAERSMELT